MTTQEKPRCPELRTVETGDETIDCCEIDGQICLLVIGERCEEYEEFLKEEENV